MIVQKEPIWWWSIDAVQMWETEIKKMRETKWLTKYKIKQNITQLKNESRFQPRVENKQFNQKQQEMWDKYNRDLKKRQISK